MGRGRGGTGTSTWRTNRFQGDRSMKGYSAGLAKALTSRESEIRSLQRENLSIFDEQGNELFRNTGTRSHVRFDGRLSKDAIVTHNHPSMGTKGRIRPDGGGSLSKKDIMNAIDLNQREVRAVTATRTYSLKRPAEGWHKGGWVGDKFYENPRRSYRLAKQTVDRNYRDYLSRFSGEERTKAHRRAFSVYWHQVNKEFARRQGYDYSSVRVD